MSSSSLLQTINSETWKQLQDLYQGASIENVRPKIESLPFDIKEKICNYCSDLNPRPSEHSFGEIDVSYCPEKLQLAIAKIAYEAFQQLNAEQQTSINLTFSLGSNFNEEISDEGINTLQLLHVLGQLSQLSSPCTDRALLIAKLKENSRLLDTAPLFISTLEIKEEAVRIEIARLCAKQSGYRTAKHIKDFDIQEETARIEIANLCVQHDCWSTAEFIQNFEIQNEAALIEIAMRCFEKSSFGIAEHIGKFGIKEEPARIKMALFCAQQNGADAAMYIQDFDIENEDALIKIAEICADQDNSSTPEYIKKFHIKDESARIQIAKICARRDGAEAAYYIKNFEIKDEAALIEIAKICAGQAGWSTGESIEKFEIKNQKALIEIAMLCAMQNSDTAELIQNFKIQDLVALQMILSYCAFSSPNCIGLLSEQVHPNINSLKDQLSKLIDPLKYLKSEMKNENPTLEELKTFLLSTISSFTTSHLKKDTSFLNQAASLNEIKDLYALQQTSTWIASMLFFLVFLDDNQQELIDKAELLKNLLSIRSPILRQNLSQLLIKLVYQKDGFQAYLNLVNCKRSKKQESPSKESKHLDLILASLQISGVSKEITTKFRAPFYRLFKGHVEIRPLLETLYLLDKSALLSPKDKAHVLNLLCAEHNDKKRQSLFALQAILLFNEEERLKESVSISELATTIFQQKLQVNIEDESFKKFQQLFMTERNPSALITYAAKLFSLNEIEIKNDISRYVNSVLQGTFSKERYELDNNYHLQKLAEYSSDLLNKWQSSLNKVSKTFLSEEQSSFDPASWLQDKVAHGHMSPNVFTHLADMLDAKELEEGSLLEVEKGLENLLKAKDKSQQIAALEEVAIELKKLPICAFQDDVMQQLGLLNHLVSNLSQEVHIIDTDDYHDLLLCGTEVVGSCQNVNGQPDFNKGLLGYILDGKNRLIAVKDKQGKIMARAKLSILWDAEKPALYLEKIYTQGKFEKQCLLEITQMALAKAQELGIPLTTDKDSEYCHHRSFGPFEKMLRSLGSGTSYEYVDALRGVQKDGIYQIDQAQIAEIL